VREALGRERTMLMRSRHATPYHAPLYLAQSKGYFKDEGVKVAILEPNDPSVSHLFLLVVAKGTYLL
jgi:ABC-type nitrate/sulfonate/bicarbonate transport system substrate-binding protein